MSGRRWTAAALLALAVAACGANRAPGDDDADGAAATVDTLEGTVRQVGSTPFARTVVEGDSASATVAGPLADEIARLTGARVRVTGSPAEGEFPGPTLRVVSYELLSVDGEEPRVGMLRHEPGAGYRLETGEGESLPLRSVPAELGSVVGGKVWVVLGSGGGVLRYGVLREP